MVSYLLSMCAAVLTGSERCTVEERLSTAALVVSVALALVVASSSPSSESQLPPELRLLTVLKLRWVRPRSPRRAVTPRAIPSNDTRFPKHSETRQP